MKRNNTAKVNNERKSDAMETNKLDLSQSENGNGLSLRDPDGSDVSQSISLEDTVFSSSPSVHSGLTGCVSSESRATCSGHDKPGIKRRDSKIVSLLSRKRLASLDEYEESLQAELAYSRQRFECECVRLVKNLLGDALPREADDADKAALKYLTDPRWTEEDVPDSLCAEDPHVLDAVRQLYQYYQCYKEYNIAFLFINIPCEPHNARRTKVEDQQANSAQIHNMYRTIIRGAGGKKQNPAYEVIISKYDDMFKNIRGFFKKHVYNCERLAIVVNGEGWGGDRAKGSLVLSEESKVIAMEEVVDDVMDIWEEALLEAASKFADESQFNRLLTHDRIMHSPSNADLCQAPVPPLPHYVSVVFGQCHSNEYMRDNVIASGDSQLEVFTLTHADIDQGRAQSTYRFSRVPRGQTRSLIDSHHRELQAFAKHNTNRQIWEKPPPPL